MLPIGSVVGGLALLVLYPGFTLCAPIFVARRLLPRPATVHTAFSHHFLADRYRQHRLHVN